MESSIADCIIEGRLNDLVSSISHLTTSLISLQDSQQNTLIHQAAQNDRVEILDHILKYVIFPQEKTSGTSSSSLIDWVNMQNNEGYTALHLAVAKGSYVKVI